MIVSKLCLVSCLLAIAASSMHSPQTRSLATPLTSSDIRLTASSASVYVNYTKSLSVNCSFLHHDNSVVKADVAVILTKQEGLSYVDIATITVENPDTVEVEDDLGATVTGKLRLLGNSNIVYQWQDPDENAQGNYRCLVHGMNHEGRPVMLTSDTTIHGESTDPTSMVDKILQLEHHQSVLQAQVVHTTNQLYAVKHELNITQSELSQTKHQLYAVKQELNTTRIELSQTKHELYAVKQELNTTQIAYSQTKQELYAVKEELNTTQIAYSHTKQQLTAVRQELSTTQSEFIQIKHQLQLSNSRLAQCESGSVLAAMHQHNLQVELPGMWISNTTFGNHTYLLSRDFSPFDVHQFESLCQLSQGDLVEIDDKHEFDHLDSFLETDNQPARQVAVGMSRVDAQARWTYLHSGQDVTFTTWDEHYPNQPAGWDCGFLNSGDHRMSNYPCKSQGSSVSSSVVRFICEVNA